MTMISGISINALRRHSRSHHRLFFVTLIFLLANTHFLLGFMSAASAQTVPQPPHCRFPDTGPPQARDLIGCPIYRDSGCCPVELSQAIQEAFQTRSTQTESAVIMPQSWRDLTKGCRDALYDLMCLQCSPNQNQFIILSNSTGAPTGVRLCKTFCDRIYRECSTAVIDYADRALMVVFEHGIELCQSGITDTTLLEITIASGQCYNAGFKLSGSVMKVLVFAVLATVVGRVISSL